MLFLECPAVHDAMDVGVAEEVYFVVTFVEVMLLGLPRYEWHFAAEEDLDCSPVCVSGGPMPMYPFFVMKNL
jgi:hypothetical protein